LQATYQLQGSRKEGSKNLLADAGGVEARVCSLEEGDFIKTVDCFFNEKGVIVGVSMVSARNVVLKGGTSTSLRKAIEM
jgi:hypothetical protein